MLILCITYHHILPHTRRHRSLFSVLQTPDVRGPTQARSAAGPAQRESAQLNPGKPSSERDYTELSEERTQGHGGPELPSPSRVP